MKFMSGYVFDISSVNITKVDEKLATLYILH